MDRTTAATRTTQDTAADLTDVSRDDQHTLDALDPERAQTRELLYDATVPRGLVHRKAVSEVFVTDSQQTGENVFEVAAQLPRGHVMLESPVYDLPLLLEACRQTGVLVSHRHLGVPMDRAFIMHRMTLDVTDAHTLRQGAEPARLLIRNEAEVHRNKGGKVRGFDFHGDVLINGSKGAEATGALIFLTRPAYDALRNTTRRALDPSSVPSPRTTPADPAVVGRRDRRNVVITDPVARGEHGWRATVVPDHNHPHLFDHPLDHLPGNLLIEAARQLSVAAVSRTAGLSPETLSPVSVRAEFTSFCENDLPTVLEADLAPVRTRENLGPVAALDVRVLQKSVVTSTFRFEVAQWT